jgi:hypothetical protein
MLSLRHNFVFVHVPKTGGNSLQSVLEEFSDDTRSKTRYWHDLHDRFNVVGPITQHKHFTSADYIERLGFSAFMGLKKISFVRNPFDRVMSHYFSPNRWMWWTPSGVRKEPYVFDKARFFGVVEETLPATDFLLYRSELIEFDFIGRYEDYERDFAKALQICGIEYSGAVPHLNRGHTGLPVRWDQEMLGVVKKKFEADFINFGY